MVGRVPSENASTQFDISSSIRDELGIMNMHAIYFKQKQPA